MPSEAIKVLNYGLVRLAEHMGSDLSIARNARVSYDAEWRAGEDEGKDEKLINYLVKNHHTSPFEAVNFTFEVKAPIFVFRQWHRHRTWCVAGQVPLTFQRPIDGKAYRKSIKDVVGSFSDPSQKKRAMQMQLRGSGQTVNVQDAWYSGEKTVFEVLTKHGAVVASADHVFKTPTGSAKLGDSPKYVMANVRVGEQNKRHLSPLTEQELGKEEWRSTAFDGYEVSSLGRLRSYFGQGKRAKGNTAKLKTLTVNNSGRSVANINGQVIQISRLVADAFIGASNDLVLHRDDQPANNRISNLYYGTALENAKDQYVNGGRVKLREAPVEVISIKKAGRQDTFDLTVSGNHWFDANGLIVHNSYNEISARYAQLPEEYYIPEVSQITNQSASNKQMRTDGIHPQAERIQRIITERCEAAFNAYQIMLDCGVPRELARGVLPMNTYSHMFASVDLLNLMRFLKLRLHSHAQYEIRVYAQAMLDLIEPIVPVTVKAFKEHWL